MLTVWFFEKKRGEREVEMCEAEEEL